jgi:hypothetical protein
MRAIVRDTYGSPDRLELPHQALGFRVQVYGVTQHKDLFTLEHDQPNLCIKNVCRHLTPCSPSLQDYLPFEYSCILLTIVRKFGSSANLVLLACHRFHQRTPRHMMLERGVQSN